MSATDGGDPSAGAAPPPSAEVDSYIGEFDDPVRSLLVELWTRVRAALPDADEAIAYGMPTFRLRGRNVIHFAGWKTHIGMYPTPSGTEAFAAEIAPYVHGKGSIRFPIDRPIPWDLIDRIVAFRADEERARPATRRRKPT